MRFGWIAPLAWRWSAPGVNLPLFSSWVASFHSLHPGASRTLAQLAFRSI
jgi:hypothetical protein